MPNKSKTCSWTRCSTQFCCGWVFNWRIMNGETNCTECGGAYTPYGMNAKKQWSDDYEYRANYYSQQWYDYNIATQLKDIFKEIFPCFPEAAQEKLKTSFPGLLRPSETPNPTFLEHQQTLYRLDEKIEKQRHAASPPRMKAEKEFEKLLALKQEYQKLEQDLEAHTVTSTAEPLVPPQPVGTAALLALPQPETVTDESTKAELNQLLAQEHALRAASKRPALNFAANPALMARRRSSSASSRGEESNTDYIDKPPDDPKTVQKPPSTGGRRQNRPRLSQDHVRGGPADHQHQEGHRRSAPTIAMSRQLQELVEPWIRPLDLDGLIPRITSYDAAILIQRYGYWPCEVPSVVHCYAGTWALETCAYDRRTVQHAA